MTVGLALLGAWLGEDARASLDGIEGQIVLADSFSVHPHVAGRRLAMWWLGDLSVYAAVVE